MQGAVIQAGYALKEEQTRSPRGISNSDLTDFKDTIIIPSTRPKKLDTTASVSNDDPLDKSPSRSRTSASKRNTHMSKNQFNSEMRDGSRN